MVQNTVHWFAVSPNCGKILSRVALLLSVKMNGVAKRIIRCLHLILGFVFSYRSRSVPFRLFPGEPRDEDAAHQDAGASEERTGRRQVSGEQPTCWESLPSRYSFRRKQTVPTGWTGWTFWQSLCSREQGKATIFHAQLCFVSSIEVSSPARSGEAPNDR